MFWLGQGGGKLANAASQIHAPTRIGHDGLIGDVDENNTIDVFISSITQAPGGGPFFR